MKTSFPPRNDYLPLVSSLTSQPTLLYTVPLQTVLAAIIMVNLLGMFKQLRDIPVLWRTSKIELVSHDATQPPTL